MDDSTRRRAPAGDGAATLGDWIRDARNSQRLTQRELADRSGLSRSYLCDIERGRGAQPSVQTLDKLAVALGAGRVDLLRVAGILQTPGRVVDESERRLLACYRDLSPPSRDAIERFARFLQADEHRWRQATLVEIEDEATHATPPAPTGPTLFDGLEPLTR